VTPHVDLRGSARLLADHRQRLIAVAIATAVLLGGYLARPERPAVAQLEERPAPLLQQVVEQRESQSFYRALQDSAASVVQHTVRVVAAARPPASWSDWEPASVDVATTRHGIVIGARELLAEGSGLQAGDPVTVTAGDGQLVTGRVEAVYRERRLARIGVDVDRALPVPRVAARPRPGDAVVGVAPGIGGPIVAPLFIAAADEDGLTTTTPLDRFPGMGIFTEARELVGIVGYAGGQPRVLPIEAATTEPPPPPAPPPSFGVSLRVEHAAEDGDRVVVAALAPGGVAARMGLRPGDRLLTSAGEPIRSIAEARAVLQQAARERRLRIARGPRVLTLRVPPLETAA
jgi:S1-C subfamily serine protease